LRPFKHGEEEQRQAVQAGKGRGKGSGCQGRCICREQLGIPILCQKLVDDSGSVVAKPDNVDSDTLTVRQALQGCHIEDGADLPVTVLVSLQDAEASLQSGSQQHESIEALQELASQGGGQASAALHTLGLSIANLPTELRREAAAIVSHTMTVCNSEPDTIHAAMDVALLLARDHDDEIRLRSVEGLHCRVVEGDERAVHVVANHLQDESLKVREAATNAIADVASKGSEDAVSTMTGALLQSSDSQWERSSEVVSAIVARVTQKTRVNQFGMLVSK